MYNLVAIPCFNEGKTIKKVVEEVLKQGVSEVLIVDDGSQDNTVEEALSAGATVVSHGENKGLGIAFQTALSYAVEKDVDIMINMDGDGQFSPQDIASMISPIMEEGYDVVVGSRFVGRDYKPENMPWIKYKGNIWMSKIISRLCGSSYKDVSCGFRAYSKEALLMANFHGKYTYTQEAFIIFSVQNLRIKEVPISVVYYKERKSRIAGSITKYAKKTLGIILSIYSDYYPLKMYGMISFMFAFLSVAFAIPFFAHYIMTGFFRGEAFYGAVSVLCLLIAILSIMIGVILAGNVRVIANQNRILYLLKKNKITGEEK